MIGGITLKICGITSVNDAVTATGVSADYLGFIFHAESPRHVSLAKYRTLATQLPAPMRKVAVTVEPADDELKRLVDLGFDAFQVHFRAETPAGRLAAWAGVAGRERLWLAPKLPPEQDVPPEWLELADTFLLDTFHPEKFGGTGKTGDWDKFKRHQERHEGKRWILSGGLNPDNVAAAVAATDALFIDVNSGVEESPGIKSQEKLFALWRALEHL